MQNTSNTKLLPFNTSRIHATHNYHPSVKIIRKLNILPTATNYYSANMLCNCFFTVALQIIPK